MAQAVTLVPTSTRFAGTGTAGFNGDFGADTALSLNHPSHMAVDITGNQYFSDTGNNCVRKVDLLGNMTTLVGLIVSGQGDTCNTTTNTAPTSAQGLYLPSGLTLDTNNNLYIADAGHNCIRKLPNGSSGTASLVTVAGTCNKNTALSATPAPSGIVLDPLNNIYIALQDTEISPLISTYQVVRQSVVSGNSFAVNSATLCVMAGTPSVNVPTTCSGVTNNVVLNAPSGLAIDFNSNLYIADTGNNCVRLITGSATQTTAVGLCANDGTGTSATALHHPYGMVFSLINALFISESSPDNIVRFLPGLGTLSLAAGALNGENGGYSTAQDGISALNITLNQPEGMTIDSNNNIYVTDSLNNIVRFFNYNYTFPNTSVPSLSGSQPVTFVINQASNLSVNVGPDYLITSDTCLGAQTAAIAGALPNTCQVFVRFGPTRPGIRYSHMTITDATAGGIVATGLEGTGTGSLGVFSPGNVATVASKLNAPTAVATDSGGNAYVLETGTTAGTADVRIITPGGVTSQLAVQPGTGLLTPSGLATDAAGNWYVVDATHGTVERFGSDGSVNTTFVTGLIAPSAIYVDGFGNIYIAQQGTAHNVIELYVSGLRRTVAGSGTVVGANNVLASTASFVSPGGFFIDVNGVLYVADTGGHRVYAIDGGALIHILAGNGTTTTTQPGVALGTAIDAPSSIAVDAAGDLYIADTAANRVYAVYEAAVSGVNIATVLGTGVAGSTGDGGPGILAQVNAPLSVALDSSGDIFVVDSGASSVREITFPSPTLAFGKVIVGTTSPVITETFLNTGTDNLSLLSAIGTTDSHFSVNSATTSCGTSILPGAFCNIGFTFTPTATLSYIAYSILQSNSYNSPETITLTGNGNVILPVTIAATTETEVYGYPFAENSTLGIGTGTTAATGTITYSVNGVTLCSVTGTLSPASTCSAANSGLSVGTYTVTITYSGDSNYAPNTSTTTLTVTPAPLTVTAASYTRAFGQPNPTLGGTLTGVVNNDTILVAYSTTATQASPAGTYPTTATLTAVGTTLLSNYIITNTPGTIKITAAALTVSVISVSRVYGQPNPVFTSTISGAVFGDTFTVTYSTTATQASGIGVYPITATVAGSDIANYTVTVVPGTLTITPAPLTVNVASFTRAYGVANPAFTSTIVGAVNGDTFTNTLSTVATITSAPGAYPILDPIVGVDLSDYTVTINPGTLTITKASVTLNVAVNNATRLYGAANPTFTSTITGALNGDTFTITYATTAVLTSPIGPYAILPTVSGAATANYTITTTNGTLTVTPAPLTELVTSFTRLYGQANPTLTGTLTGLLNGDIVTPAYATTALQTSPIGPYPITATLTPGGATSLANYAVTNTPGTLTITAATLTISIVNVSRVYGQPNPAFTDTVSGALFGDTFTLTYSTTATQASGVGVYPITATVAGSDIANYSVTVVPGTLSITPASLTVNVASFTRAYGVANPALTSTIVGAVNGDTFTNTTSTVATITSAPGAYPILDPIVGVDLSDYTVTMNNGTLTITKATVPLTVAVNNATRLYGAANPTFTSTIAGALNGDTFTITYATTAVLTSPIGPYAIVPTVSGAATANYTITTANGTLTVTAAPLSVVAANATRTYGSANPAFTGTATGLLNGDTVTATYASAATATTGIGTYTIVPTVSGAALSNYTLTTTNGVLTITPLAVNVTITPNNATRIYGTYNPTFVGVITGAVNGDILTAAFSTTATITSNVGTYSITAALSGANAANYTAIVIPAVLTITVAPTTTALTTSGSPVRPGTAITFTATVTAPLTVATVIGAPLGAVSFFDGGTLLGTSTLNAAGVATFGTSTFTDGTHIITATYLPGTLNFLASSSVAFPQIISGSFGISATPPTAYIRGAGNTVYAVTVNSLQGFTGPVALTCSGMPADATCTFAAATLTLTANGTATTLMTVTNTAADAQLLKLPGIPSSGSPSITSLAMLPFALGGIGMLFIWRRRLNPRNIRLLLVCLAAVGMMGMAGCGCPNSAFKSYPITITGTNITTPSASTTVILSVGLAD